MFDLNTTIDYKHASRGRKTLIVLILAFFGLMLVGWAVSKWRSMSRSPDRLDLMATVRPDDQFWLRYKGERHLLSRDQGVALLRAMATAHPWESEVGYFNRGTYPPHFLPMKAKLIWCKDGEDQRELEENVLWIHSRNETISYKGEAYVVQAEGREILDRMFPIGDEK